jgi:hypothetical protein
MTIAYVYAVGMPLVGAGSAPETRPWFIRRRRNPDTSRRPAGRPIPVHVQTTYCFICSLGACGVADRQRSNGTPTRPGGGVRCKRLAPRLAAVNPGSPQARDTAQPATPHHRCRLSHPTHGHPDDHREGALALRIAASADADSMADETRSSRLARPTGQESPNGFGSTRGPMLPVKPQPVFSLPACATVVDFRPPRLRARR